MDAPKQPVLGTTEWFDAFAHKISKEKGGDPEHWFHLFFAAYEKNHWEQRYRGLFGTGRKYRDRDYFSFLWHNSPITRFPIENKKSVLNVYAIDALHEGYLRKWEYEGKLKEFARLFKQKGIVRVKPKYIFTEERRKTRITVAAAIIATLFGVITTIINLFDIFYSENIFEDLSKILTKLPT